MTLMYDCDENDMSEGEKLETVEWDTLVLYSELTEAALTRWQ